jgi:hypothetical protein
MGLPGVMPNRGLLIQLALQAFKSVAGKAAASEKARHTLSGTLSL